MPQYDTMKSNSSTRNSLGRYLDALKTRKKQEEEGDLESEIEVNSNSDYEPSERGIGSDGISDLAEESISDDDDEYYQSEPVPRKVYYLNMLCFE